jgi:hypothetical protein
MDITDGVTTKVYTYEADAAPSDEMTEYARYLTEKDGFLRLEDENPDAFATLGRNSVDAGQCLTVTILVSGSGYTVTIAKQAGQITPNAPEEPTGPNAPTGPEDQYDPNNYPEDILEDPILPAYPWTGIWQFTGANTENLYLYRDGTFQLDIYYDDGSEDRSITGNYYVEAGRISLYDAFENGAPINDIEMTFTMPDDYTALIDGAEYKRIEEGGD